MVKTIVSWSVSTVEATAQIQEQLSIMIAAGQTDGTRVVQEVGDSVIIERIWVDLAAATEWVEFLGTLSAPPNSEDIQILQV